VPQHLPPEYALDENYDGHNGNKREDAKEHCGGEGDKIGHAAIVGARVNDQ
jgi:hypothetical protein